MNSKGEENRSVRLTRKRLSDALITLLMQKPVREITVRELTELANVSRGTFYFHYTDIYDLMDHVEREQIHTLELLMDDILPRLEEDSTPEALRALFSYLDENDGICSVLLGTNGDTAFVHRLKGVIEESCLGYLRPREKETQLQRYMVAFAVQGCFGNIDLWLQNGKPETVDEMADITFYRSLSILMDAFMASLQELLKLSDEQLARFTADFESRLPEYLRNALHPLATVA